MHHRTASRLQQWGCFIAVALSAAFLQGCGAPKGFKPIDPQKAVFWDRQTSDTAELLRNIADEFNAKNTGLPIYIERVGDYTEIFRKVRANIQARTLPAMSVSYPAMTGEYVLTGCVAPLDGCINDPEQGFSKADLDDFFPKMIENSRFAQFGGKMYSFPFAKSVLMMYYNTALLKRAGVAEPPATWDDFIADCRKVKETTGKFGYAVSVDCSTVVAMIYSMGGEVMGEKATRFDSPEAIRVFEVFETLSKEGLCYQIQPGTFDDEVALSNGEAAFMIRTSSMRASLVTLMKDRMDDWGIARIPQADPAHPATVLFGPDVTIFTTTEAHQRAAWAFTRYFASPDVCVRWAVETGYLPMRRSAAQDPRMQAYWAEFPGNRAPFDCLEFARPEPNVNGWQEVRETVQESQTAILTGRKTGKAAALDLKAAADAILARN